MSSAMNALHGHGIPLPQAAQIFSGNSSSRDKQKQTFSVLFFLSLCRRMSKVFFFVYTTLSNTLSKSKFISVHCCCC